MTELFAEADVNVVAVDPAVVVIASGAPTVPEDGVAVASDLELAVAHEIGDLVPTAVDERSAGVLVPVGGRLLDATTGRPALVLVGDPALVGPIVVAAQRARPTASARCSATTARCLAPPSSPRSVTSW